MASIALGDGGQRYTALSRRSPGLLQMKFYRIDQVDFVSLLGERQRVNSGPAAHIKNDCRRRRKVPSEKRLGPKPFQLTPSVR